jgi:hypothetical protein
MQLQMRKFNKKENKRKKKMESSYKKKKKNNLNTENLNLQETLLKISYLPN